MRIEFKITDENINDIVCTALEGGINYWCNRVKVKGGDYKGTECASDSVSLGATLLLHTIDGEVAELNKSVLERGVALFMEEDGYGIIDPETLTLDTGQIDADVADIIIQLAVFGENIYG